MRTALFVLATAALITGCAALPQGPREVHLKNQFDQAAAERLLAKGSNTVRGSALVRQQGGGVVTCAGLEVSLIPVTDYANERIQTIYGSQNGGFADVIRSRVVFVPDSASYLLLRHKTRCDAQGFFKFDNVADGAFYVNTVITWNVGNVPNGGALLRMVRLSGGEIQDIVMAP